MIELAKANTDPETLKVLLWLSGALILILLGIIGYSYEVGTKVTHNGVIYECIDPTYAWIEPGTQDSHFGWTVVT